MEKVTLQLCPDQQIKFDETSSKTGDTTRSELLSCKETEKRQQWWNGEAGTGEREYGRRSAK